MIELVIFDCDGVLIDSERLSVKVDIEVLNGLGLKLTEAQVIEKFVGGSDSYFRSEVEKMLGHTFFAAELGDKG